MNTTTTYTSLTPKTISDVRKLIDARAYKRSMSITWFWCILDIACYSLALYGIFAVHNVWAQLLLGVVAGIAASSMFVLAHDAAHGALFKSRWVAEIMGTIYMLPALNVYRLWCFGHNRVHHGFTSFSPIDWIWRPLTIDEYINLSWMQKLLYKVERSFYGCGLHYIRQVWWSKMLRFMPDDFTAGKKWAIHIGKLVVLTFALIVGGIFFVHNGVVGVLAGLVIPFIVFNYVISLVVYVHHTHPDIPFFDERNEWNHTIGAMFCTTVIHTNWLIDRWITHNILIHTPHHIDIRIPFYRLRVGFDCIKKHYSEYLHEYHLDLHALRNIFKSCKLYDYHKHIWYTFDVTTHPVSTQALS